jgi:REP element-mobilizing transposase RayT
MTAPRQVLPGVTYLVTRRCARRELLLRPGRITTELFRYVLALATHRYGVRVHAFCVLSNHYHLVVTDPDARLPAFHQFLDSLVARALNAALGRWEAFWDPNSYSAVALATPDDVVAKAAYVLANPVAAGLVRRGRLWPGLWSGPEQVGAGALPALRPGHFFDRSGDLPQELGLELTVPPGFESAEAYRARLESALEAQEAEGARKHRQFLGAVRVLAQKPTARPKGGEPRRTLNPRVAARDRWKRVEALGRLVEFLRAYREAWAAWQQGARDVVFPAGTYLLRVVHGVSCEPCAG